MSHNVQLQPYHYYHVVETIKALEWISVFQIDLRDGGNPPSGEMRNFAGEIFLLDGGNLKRSDFDDSNLFQS